MSRLICLLCLSGIFTLPAAAADQPNEEFFEKQIRPLLSGKCVKCHGPKEQSGGLRLDTRAAILKGGDSGAAILPTKPEESLLVAAVRRDGDVQMPPKEPLSRQQIDALVHWVKLGAPWPQSVVIKGDTKNTPHWAFQPVEKPAVPPLKSDWVRSPIDAFVLARLQENKLFPSPPTDRRTLARRASFDLLGLPPTPSLVEKLTNNDDPSAAADFIDQLLESPHYGEKSARNWLDLARYSDTKGYVYAREERFWVHAWSYRDWVVRAFNDDLPYNRFLLLQIAADQVKSPRRDLAAMGFLTLGRRFLGVTHDIIDDRIDVVTRGTMALTVSCARCHDHKYDPIPTRDYYSLYGVFRNSIERLVPLAEPSETKTTQTAFDKGLQDRQAKLQTTMTKYRAAVALRVRKRAAEYLQAQLELEKYPEEGFDQILTTKDMMPAFVRRWRDFLARAKTQNDPVFAAWRQFQAIPKEKFATEAAKVSEALQSAAKETVDPRVAAIFAKPPANMPEVAIRYGELFTEVLQQREQREKQTNQPDAREEDDPIAQVLFGPRSPCEVPDASIINTEMFFPNNECEQLWRLQGEVDRWLIRSRESPPYAMILSDRAITTNARVLKRGNPALLGDEVPRQFLAVLSGEDRKPFAKGSGRLELAEKIIDPKNPLTARVAVNRVWMHHFGNGLVRTPGDFGRRADPPSHPKLLDWLAASFVEHGWSLKWLHREIMRSSTYQQSSFGPNDEVQLARARQLDPDNRLLWRMNTRRLSFEELRDAALTVTGELDRKLGGKPVKLFGAQVVPRRTLYGQVDRQFLPGVLRVFDFANPDLPIPRRAETTVPQQALFFMNHPFLVARAQALAKRTGDSASLSSEARIKRMYQSVYQRDPTTQQLASALQFIESRASETQAALPSRADDWKYGFGEFQADAKRVDNFTPLPHFTGNAWQGGPKWPDSKLGWVQLTAQGGHAGNDRKHAAVRRFTAPREMNVRIESTLIHEAKPGDGVRGFLVSSRQGLIKSANVHQRKETFQVDSLKVEPGENLDFVVDLRDNLNHEEYLWEATITEVSGQQDATPHVWNSRRDFAGTPTVQLGPWEKLAQVLLATNEFLFID